MKEKLKNDATQSTLGTLYQFYISLEYCFNLVAGQKIYIEKYGDITVSEGQQIEVKKYSDELTDLHYNIWKTLGNWIDEKFDPSKYKDLILLTTQKFNKNSNFKNWNDKLVKEKFEILNSVAREYEKKAKKDTEKEILIKSILSNNNEAKLKNILEKFIILDSSLLEFDLYNKIKHTFVKSIESINQDDFLNSLLGYILSPQTTIGNGWEISYEDFASRVQSLNEQFATHTKIFPSIKRNISEDEIEIKENSLFVKKIDDMITYNIFRTFV